MAGRRFPENHDPKVREEVSPQVKQDPRRDGSGPDLINVLVFDLQKEIVELKKRVLAVENELAREMALRIEMGRAPAAPAPPPAPPAALPGPSAAEIAASKLADPHKPTRLLRAPSPPPPPLTEPFSSDTKGRDVPVNATKQMRMPSRRPAPITEAEPVAPARSTKQMRVPSRRPPPIPSRKD